MIVIDGVSKIFRSAKGDSVALKDVHLSVRRGEIVGVIGRSGAGKSTLARCVNLLERPTSGRIVVAGEDLTAQDGARLRQARRAIGMIFQHFNLLSSRTVFDNVALPLELQKAPKADIRQRVTSLLDLVGLADKRDRYPAALSGGQKQRVGIARALASQPSVLLCDEATSALDPETTKSILQLLKDINIKLGLTILIITHEMQVIKEICDRVVVLDHGQVVEQGPVFDVFTSPASEITRNIVRDVIDRELPALLRDRLCNGPRLRGNPVLRIVFTGASAGEPVIAEIARRHDVLLNIWQANVEYIQGLPYGNIVVEAIGALRELQAAIDDIRDRNLSVEVLGHVASDDSSAA
jgi:D-methionine transport system ATP-binding protein